MDKILLITMLYDFYSELLTDKQKTFIELYYFNDFSLNEIAEQYNITRQAVRDMIKRTEKILSQYEEKLLLIDKYLKQKEKLNNILEILNEVIDTNNLKQIYKFNDIKNMLAEIID